MTGDLPEAAHHGAKRTIRALSCLVDVRAVTPLWKGFLDLAAFADLFFRHLLSRKVSNSLEPEFCL